MKNLKPHHHLALVSFVIFGVVSIWTWGTVVFASSSGTTVSLYLGPPDSCLNIPGYQVSAPDGMLVDGDGNCYTPPPAPTDLCDNIDGIQDSLPAGYYRSSQNCLPQTTPPKDVCPNLTDMQASVPADYTMTDEGRCVTPPADMCTNITGTQIIVPGDLERSDSGVCFTPSSTSPPVIPPATPHQDSNVIGAEDLKNVPTIFEPFLRPLVDLVPETVKDALRSLPPVVARTFPYFTFSILAIAGFVMSWQSVREAIMARRIARLVRREHEIADEKDSFIHLVSGYLKTPIDQMKMAVQHLQGVDEKPLSASLALFEKDVETIVASVENNKALQAIQPPAKTRFDHLSFLASSFFWMPVIVAMLIVWAANFLLGVVGEVELGTFNVIAQVGVFIVTALFFYSSLRTRTIKQHERAYRERVLEYEQALDHARNEFISTSARTLRRRLGDLGSKLPSLDKNNATQQLMAGFDHMTHLLKIFSLLTEIETGVVGASEKFNLKDSVDALSALYKSKLESKQLTIINDISSSSIRQRRSLFDFVLGSALENAIESSSPGSTITISSRPGEHSLTVHITDPKSDTSTNKTHDLRLAYDGLGLNLFLDKILTSSVGRPVTR